MIVASAPDIVRALGGRWSGAKGMCCCPAHDDSTPSMLVSATTDGRPLVYCYGGCQQMAVIDALRKRSLWPDGPVEADPSAPMRLTTKPDGLNIDDRKRRAWAYEIWSQAVPINGTIAETYLRLRGLTGRLSESLRYAPALKHPQGFKFPALVGRITTGLGEFTGIQRIFLERDGTKAKADPVKATLGPMVDGAVRLGQPDDVLGIAEGIETALAAHQMFRVPVWACLGAARLGKVGLPPSVKQVWIFADNGDVGRREAHRAAQRYDLEGLTAIVRPPDGEHADHNDWLLADAGRAA